MFHKFPGKLTSLSPEIRLWTNIILFQIPNLLHFIRRLKYSFSFAKSTCAFRREQKNCFGSIAGVEKYPKPISVILRNHPQHPDLLHHFHRNFPFPIIERNDTPLQKELLENDIIITQVTSAAVEAIIFKKPLIYLNTYSVKNIRNFATSGAALGVYEISELIPAINSLFKNPGQLGHQQDRFISKYCGKIDGKASRRIMAHLESLLQKTPHREDTKSNPTPIYLK